MTTRLNLLLLALILIVGIPYYWLLIDDSPGDAKAKPISISQLRDLAQSIPGPAPESIRFESVAGRLVPRIVLAAGQGIKFTDYLVYSYRLEVPGKPPIMIDSGISRSAAAKLGLKGYDAEAQDRITSELRKAQLVLTLGGNATHSGGLHGAGIESPAQTSDSGATCSTPNARAPGVVEIPICERMLDKRLVYVRLADGHEYLFAGDVAPIRENLLYQAGPSRLFGDLIRDQDRTAIHSWLLTIANLEKQAPRMTVVFGHASMSPDLLARGFDEAGKP